MQITLPEISLWVDEAGQVSVNRINRESAGRMLVAEIMIMANWLMGRFLADRGLPAVFPFPSPIPRSGCTRASPGRCSRM